MAPADIDMTDYLRRQVADFEEVDLAARELITLIDYPPHQPWSSEEMDELGAIYGKELAGSTEVERMRQALKRTAP